MKKIVHTNFGTLDPIKYTRKYNFGAKSNIRKVNKLYSTYDSDQVIWQEATYELAKEILKSRDQKYLVDIGAGSGVKYKIYDDFHDLNIIAVDYENNIKEKSRKVDFIQCNLEDYSSLSNLEQTIENASSTFLVADVIEHLEDVRPLLRTLRKLLKRNPENCAVISTPDRSFGESARNSFAPTNISHVREWKYQEFHDLFASAGFQIIECGHIPNNNFDPDYKTSYLVVKCSQDYYEDFLKRANLPLESRHLRIINEHGSLNKTGGIGTYWLESEKAIDEALLNLFVGAYGLPDFATIKYIRELGWFHTSEFSCNSDWLDSRLDYEGVLDSVLDLVYLYDKINIIEFADYLGLGFLVNQAKLNGLLPPEIQTICYCHGNCFYLDFAAENISTSRDLDIDIRENASIESSDIVIFPSKFLGNLYSDVLKLEINKAEYLRYPFSVEFTREINPNYVDVDTLIYYGRATNQKGFDLFLEAVKIIHKDFPHVAKKLPNVILAGVDQLDIPADFKYKVKTFKGNRSQAQDLLSDNRTNGIVVLPYRADNQPFAVYEALSSGATCIFAEAGGIPEQIDFLKDLSYHPLVELSPKAIAEKIVGLVENLSPWDRYSNSKKIHDQLKPFIEINNRYFADKFKDYTSREFSKKTPVGSKSYSVVMCTFNGDIKHISDALFGITNSISRASKILIVNDGSTSEFSSKLQELVYEFEVHNIEILTNSTNRGLAYSRNFGVSHVEDEYVLVIDDDNIVRNNFASLALKVLDNNEKIAAVSSWTTYFEDGSEWNNLSNLPESGYRPLGANYGLGFFQNSLGDATAMYRVSAIQDVGGWDSSSSSKWEDWQLYLKFTLSGMRISIIPRTFILYRVRKQSMLRTYPDFPGWIRIMHALPVPDGEKYVFLRALKSNKNEQQAIISTSTSAVQISDSSLSSLRNNKRLKAILRRILIATRNKLRRSRSFYLLIIFARKHKVTNKLINAITSRILKYLRSS